MNLKNLLLNYINDINDKSINYKLKTLEDNPKYKNEKNRGLKKKLLDILNILKLPINDINEENLSPENIDSILYIKNNKKGNHIEKNET